MSERTSPASTSCEEVCIGVTGHRTLSELDKIESGIDQALNRIEQLFPGRPWRVISSLAEGADRIVVRRVMARRGKSFRLTMPLPLEENDYIRDFASPESTEEFRTLKTGLKAEIICMPKAPERSQAYASAGKWIVEHSDVILAVWDGRQSQGKGGTGDVVAEARRDQVCIAWVHAGNRRPGTDEETSLGAQQGEATFEEVERSVFRYSDRRLENALRKRDERALLYQRRRANFARFAITLGPLAAVLLALQALVYQHGGPVAIGLISGELVVLALALSVGFFQFGRSHHQWILERLRAELLRRERFLVQARVGPYLGVRVEGLSEEIDRRLLAIDNNLDEPETHLEMRDAKGDWYDQLLDTRNQEALQSVPDLPDCLSRYLEERVEDQRSWHASHAESHGKRARVIENGARLMLVIALVGAAIHLGMLITGQSAEGPLHTSLAIVLLTTPLLGSALVGFLAVLGSQRLSRSYRIEALALQHLKKQMIGLRAQIQNPTVSRRELEFEFQRTVLKVEGVLSDHFLAWWLIMVTEAPGANG